MAGKIAVQETTSGGTIGPWTTYASSGAANVTYPSGSQPTSPPVATATSSPSTSGPTSVGTLGGVPIYQTGSNSYTRGSTTLTGNPKDFEYLFGAWVPTGTTSSPSSSGTVTSPTNSTTSQPSNQQTQQTTQQTQQATQPVLQMPANGSIVDLLNSVGQNSSFAARQALAQQFGVQGYTGTAAQNTDLAKKYIDAYNAQKGTVAPTTPAEARATLQNYFTTPNQLPGTPEQQFYDLLGAQNPVEAALFQQLSGLLSSQQNQQSLTEFYQQEVANQGIPGLQMELTDLNRIMDGTEDDIRDEVTHAGGFVTESQVQALSAARNKTLLKRANYLSNVIAQKNDYVNNIVSLTKADREQVNQDLDRKLGITKMMFDMQQQMQNNARENYNQIISNIGYDGLVNSISSPQELATVAKSLGMTPQTLLQLSTIPTSKERDQELATMNYQLSVDKFNEDKRQFGMQYALEAQKVALQKAASQVISPYQQERSTRTLDTIQQLLPQVSNKTVGLGSWAAYLPNTDSRNFAAQVESLKASITQGELAAMREASKTGGALGNVSDTEGRTLAASLGALDTGQSPDAFKKQLEKIQGNIYRWNNEVLSISNDIDYQAAKDYYMQVGKLSDLEADQKIYNQLVGIH